MSKREVKVLDTITLRVLSRSGEGEPTPEPAATPEPTPEPSGLPSDTAAEQKSPWERAKEDGYLAADASEDPYELAKQLKQANEFGSKMRSERDAGANADSKAADLAAKNTATKEGILDMVPDFINNGMELTEDMKAKATELGITESELKLGAYETRDRMNAAYDVVGGQEEYGSMMTDMAEVMTPEQKKAFNTDMHGSASEYAIKGLHAEWKARQSGTDMNKPRIEGKVAGGGSVKPYATQAEMMKDNAYFRTRQGKVDTVARAQYEKRLAATPDKVIYGR